MGTHVASRAAIVAAENLGATQHAPAAQALRTAREEATRADRLARQGRQAEASGMWMRARADAEVAAALANERRTRAETSRSIERLRQIDGTR
jgi:hypothetical protein